MHYNVNTNYHHSEELYTPSTGFSNKSETEKKYEKIKNYLQNISSIYFNDDKIIDISTLTRFINKSEKFLKVARSLSYERYLQQDPKHASILDEAEHEVKEFKERLSIWSDNKIISLKQLALDNHDKTLFKILEISENMDKYLIEADTHLYNTSSCGLSALAITQELTNISSLKSKVDFLSSDDLSLLRRHLGKSDENLFYCQFGGLMKGSRTCGFGHSFVLHEKKFGDDEYKYRLYNSYLNHYELKNYLAASIDSENQGWMSQEEGNHFIDRLDRFIADEEWTAETVADFFLCFGVKEHFIGRKLVPVNSDESKFQFVPILKTSKINLKTIFFTSLVFTTIEGLFH